MAALTVGGIQRHLASRADWHLHLFDELSSTSSVALEMADAGAPHGTAVLANCQTAGRGREGREWRTPRGTAIALSVVVRPTSGPDWWPWIGLATAVATQDAIERIAGVIARVKWPNDVLIGGRKVAGVLTETRWHPVRAGHRAVVVGVGVNVNNRAAALPESYAATAASILDVTGTITDRNALVAEILNGLAREIDGLPQRSDELRSRWMAVSATTASQVTVSTPAGLLEGVDDGLGPLSQLIVRTREGRAHLVHTGEVLLLRTVSPPAV